MPWPRAPCVLAVVWARLGSAWANVVLAVSLIGIFHFWWYLVRVKLPDSWFSKAMVSPAPEFPAASRSKSGKNGPRFRLDRARNLCDCIALPGEVRAAFCHQIVDSRRRRCFASTRIFLPWWHVSCTISAVIDKGALRRPERHGIGSFVCFFLLLHRRIFICMDPASGCGEHIVDHRDAALQPFAECWPWPGLSPTASAQDAGWIFAQPDDGSDSCHTAFAESSFFSFVRLAGTGG